MYLPSSLKAIGAFVDLGINADRCAESNSDPEPVDDAEDIAGQIPTCPIHILFTHFKTHLVGESALHPTNASCVSLLIHIAAVKSGSEQPSTKHNINVYIYFTLLRYIKVLK